MSKEARCLATFPVVTVASRLSRPGVRATSTDALYLAFLKGAVAAVGDSGVVTSLSAAASPTATLGDYYGY